MNLRRRLAPSVCHLSPSIGPSDHLSKSSAESGDSSTLRSLKGTESALLVPEVVSRGISFTTQSQATPSSEPVALIVVSTNAFAWPAADQVRLQSCDGLINPPGSAGQGWHLDPPASQIARPEGDGFQVGQDLRELAVHLELRPTASTRQLTNSAGYPVMR